MYFLATLWLVQPVDVRIAKNKKCNAQHMLVVYEAVTLLPCFTPSKPAASPSETEDSPLLPSLPATAVLSLRLFITVRFGPSGIVSSLLLGLMTMFRYLLIGVAWSKESLHSEACP